MRSKFSVILIRAARRPAWQAALVASAIAVTGLGSAQAALAGPSVGASQYPNLKMLSPSELRVTTRAQPDGTHHLLRFTTRIWNAGEGAFELDRTPVSETAANLTQRIYEGPAGFQDEPIGTAAFTAFDFSFPVPDIAHYEVWAERAFLRAQARGFTRGGPLFVNGNVGFCVADSEQVDPNATVGPYNLCTKFVTGISAGWSDVTSWIEPFQSIDFGTTMPADGDYVLRAIADPHNRLFESADRADPARESVVANSAVSYFRIVNGQLAGTQ